MHTPSAPLSLPQSPRNLIIICIGSPGLPFRPLRLCRLTPAERQLSEAHTKRTCLWTGGGFQLPEHKAVVPILGSRMHNLPDSKNRANLRSATPAGFARAVFEANCPAFIATS